MTFLSAEDRAHVERFRKATIKPRPLKERFAHEMVERSGGSEALGDLYDTFIRLVESRPTVKRIDVVRGDIPATLYRVELALQLG